MSKVDIAVNEYLDGWSLERSQFDTLKAFLKARILRDIFQLIVAQPESHEKLDPAVLEMIHPLNYSDRWDALVKAHPDLIDILLECWSLVPPSFNRVLELGAVIMKLEVSPPIY